MDDNTLLPFGDKYKGKPLKDIPDRFFIWLHDRKQLNGELKEYAEQRVPQLMVLKEIRERKKDGTTE